VNFSLFSRDATRVRLELFARPEDAIPQRGLDLDPVRNRTGDVWHVWVGGIAAGQLYAYRVDGPYDPEQGQRFNFKKLLLDPLATAISSLPPWNPGKARGYDPGVAEPDLSPSVVDNAAFMPKCVFVNEGFDWRGDKPPKHPWSRTFIYEAHVRGFTIHPSAGVGHPGTYLGMVEKIPYLKSLGVTAVELMPVQEFDGDSALRPARVPGRPLTDYWGYNPVVFSAPKASYSSAGGLGQQKLEFKEMVRAFHQAGMEVILDVVFNHTAEGNALGPTFSFRGLANRIAYILEADKKAYKDYTGTGNTINANHPVMRDHILSALRHWMVDMHVDGFRFDLALVLGRDGNGDLLASAPLLARIAEDPVLRGVKIIAEPWDAAGGYEVGSFSEQRWAEWNDHYRDDVRRFWRGDPGALGPFCSRLGGSADLYARSGKSPKCSINFVTCHDGFTLNDLVSYGSKHNEANGENNRDGTGNNLSDNHGAEGATRDAAIEKRRDRQIKNFLLTLMVSRGVPMLLGGDEFRRTQGGNNNAYCQDNETSWLDWGRLKQHGEIFRFAQGMAAFRLAHPILSDERFYTDHELQWFGPSGALPDWGDPGASQVACLIGEGGGHSLLMLFNAGTAAAQFALPPAHGAWRIAADTAQAPPLDLFSSGQEPPCADQHSVRLHSKSAVLLLAW
jgi:glycogen operon protein